LLSIVFKKIGWYAFPRQFKSTQPKGNLLMKTSTLATPRSLKRNLLSVAVMLQLGFAPNVFSEEVILDPFSLTANDFSYDAIFLPSEKEFIIPTVSVKIGDLTFSYSVKLSQSPEDDSRFLLSEIKEHNNENNQCSAIYSIETGELYLPCAETGTPTLLYADNVVNPASFSVYPPEIKSIESIARRSRSDYPYQNECPSPSGGKNKADKWNFFRCECTSYVAAMLTKDGIKVNNVPFTNYISSKKVGKNLTDRWSNADLWKDKATSLGLTVDKNPRKGDIAWWDKKSGMPNGHVAYVDTVNSNGTITISEYNYSSYKYGTRTISQSVPDGYIHFTSPKLELVSTPSINPNPIIQGQAVSVTARIKNGGTAIFDGYISTALHKTTGEFLGDISISNKVTIGIGKDVSLTFKKLSISSPFGNYVLKTKFSSDSKTWIDISSTPVQITSVFPLSVNNKSVSMGKITSLPSGIDCGLGKTTCTVNYVSGTTVKLIATPKDGYVFTGWSSPCSGTSSCSITVNGVTIKNVTANFSVKPPQTSSLSINNSAIGKVTSTSSPNINCGSGSNLCSASYANSSVVTLTASPNNGYVFSNWSGACSGSNVSCSVRLDGNKTVTANFVAATSNEYKLTVQIPEHGKIVTYDYNGNTPNNFISCGGGENKCESSFKKDNSVRFVLIPDSRFKSLGWICTGGAVQNGECVVTATANNEKLTKSNPIKVPAFIEDYLIQFSQSVEPVNFGDQNIGIRSEYQTLTIENKANNSPSITVSLVGENADQFNLALNSQLQNYPLVVNGQADIKIRFAPTSSGEKTAKLRVAISGSPSVIEKTISGVAIDPTPIVIDPTPTPTDVVTDKNIQFTEAVDNKTFYGFSVDSEGNVNRTNEALNTVLISGETTHTTPQNKIVISLIKDSDNSVVETQYGTNGSLTRNDFLKFFQPAVISDDVAMLHAEIQIFDANGSPLSEKVSTKSFQWCRNKSCSTSKYKLTLLPIGAGNVNWSTDKGNSGSSPLSTTTLFTQDFDAGTQIALTKGQPVLDFKYGGFTETPCTGQSTCNITMDSNKTIVVTFSGMSDGHFSISRIGRGSITNLNTGTVIVNDNMLSSSSNALYKPKGIYTLKAQANTGYTFKKWIGGDCTGYTQLECNTNFTGTSQAIVAIFEPNA